jgi:hypothetical protein
LWGGAVAPFLTLGSGSDTIGYRLGFAGGSTAYLIVAPKSSEVQRGWGSSGTARGAASLFNGVDNTNILYSYGSAAHPAAYYCKTSTTGGYNTWYMPAKDELLTCYSNKSAVPFATENAFVNGGYGYISSTEYSGIFAWAQGMVIGGQGQYTGGKNNGNYRVRAVRQYYSPVTIGGGSSTTGFWLGTAGDGTSKLIVAPKSTEISGASSAWGSSGTIRGTTSTTDGGANTNTLYGFGSSAHPVAYYAKSLSTGGYNTWYLPAKDELLTLYSNKAATPFATANAFAGNYYWSSTEVDASNAIVTQMSNSTQTGWPKSNTLRLGRAVRRTTV